ncbi:hypothetical protein VOLCADRAFT_120785 [Volvox carteri f. nagariensis]|uniref:DNA-directed primase/polymerase protein n=1 Tax=Volvox carteri f. nagariensis TaxID=3068 RepID=D8TTF1_VOLCA|nr:uncharacterized protein VOLCADRAFT_120785 [Volvox carteri f. nagariensis]EFJ49295.1 hypothetical protein VOLCADRAFT_120785 [Volvox carteri f. nagariensis]|eukprot:XP_002949743.1 hypothetical protein VOLCADRAFT_120785 [Volvox carteri f. nagariensis]
MMFNTSSMTRASTCRARKWKIEAVAAPLNAAKGSSNGSGTRRVLNVQTTLEDINKALAACIKQAGDASSFDKINKLATSMQSKSTSLLPKKPADYEEFIRKLADQQRSTPYRCSDGPQDKGLLQTGHLKRPNEFLCDIGTAARKRHGNPRIKPESAFYDKRTAVSGFSSKTVPNEELRCDASRAPRADAPAAASPDPELLLRDDCAKDASAVASRTEMLRGNDAQTAIRSDTCSPRQPLWMEASAPRAEFKLQQQAFEFLDQQRAQWLQHLRVFGKELSGDGKRRFLVTTPARLWVEDVELAEPGSCHLYEILREGSPCHLYFDLEFVPEFNPGVCGDLLVDLLVDLVAEELLAAFGIQMPLQDSRHWRGLEQQQRQQQPEELEPRSDGSCPWVWELCSTTAAKFSRHLVIRIPHCAFKDNFHVNAFVRRLFDRIAADPVRFGAFFVRRSADEDGPRTLFIDPAVYTRNRAFRLYLSSKAGKTAVLRATSRYAVAALLRQRGIAFQEGGATATAAHARPSSQEPASAPQPTGSAPVDPLQRVLAVPRPQAAERATCSEGPADSPATDHHKEAADRMVASGPASRAPPPAAAAQPPDVATCGGRGGLLLPPRVERAVAKDIFMASLVTGMSRVDRVLTLYDDFGGGGAGGAGATALAGFHAARPSYLGIPRLPLPAGGGGAPAPSLQPHGSGASIGPHQLPGVAAIPLQYGPSPFPCVDEFIESVCCEGGVQGRVRCWQYLAGSGILLLSMRNNRWCANVGRPHRSNVDLRGGTWCQRCYDPECRDFRSARMPLPIHLWEECRHRAAGQQQQHEQGKPHAPPFYDKAPDGPHWQKEQRAHGQQQGRAEGEHAAAEGFTAPATGVNNTCSKDDDDPDYDLLCVQALERLEEQIMALNGAV